MINYNLKDRQSTFWSNLFKAPAERSDLEEVLHSMPPFKNFNSTQLKQLLKLVHNRVYSANEYIFYQGDPGIALYIIREGEIKVVKNSDQDKEMELTRFGRGDFFGELALMDTDLRSASAIALTDSNLGAIFKPDIDKFIEKFPKKGVEILR
jgi:CRP-like cAMP-binding protein